MFRLWKLCELEKNKHTLHCMLWPTHCVLFVNKRGPSVYCLKGGSFAILGYILGSVHEKGNMKGIIRILNKCGQYFFAFAFLCESNDDNCDNDDGDDDDDDDDDDGDDDDMVGDLHFLVLVELLVRHDGGGGVVGGLRQDRRSVYIIYQYISVFEYMYIINI